eukprot:TRINITY_DN1788_c0_g1_i3.p1 TRINITY_DN1788_c0_g1~~TRINITY_DN1788_c0_g1_i3.p1  ORF type:complete len:387 (+),score=84.23 TRINITY_DN1788_c0_g1_i3:127-1287(+)
MIFSLDEIHSIVTKTTTFEEFEEKLENHWNQHVDGKSIVIAGETIENGYQECLMEQVDSLDLSQLKSALWIDFNCPSKEDLERLEEKLGLHPLTVEDVREEAREKIESFENYLFIIVRQIDISSEGSNQISPFNINIIIFHNLIITIHYHVLECINQVYYRLEQHRLLHQKIIPTSDWILHSVLDSLVDIFVIYVDAISREAEALDELVLVFNSDVQNDLLRRIGSARRILTSLRSHVWSIKELLSTLNAKEHSFLTQETRIHLRDMLENTKEHKSGKENSFVSQETRIYLRDVLDNTVKMEEKLHNAKEMVNNLHSTYLARISVEVAEYSNQVNKIVKKFGAVATIFIPLTLIAGLVILLRMYLICQLNVQCQVWYERQSTRKRR